MSKKFEQLLEYVVNNDTEKAQALFHDIVVGKSREIYENLIAAEADEMDENGVGGGQVESLLDEIGAEEGDMSAEGDDMDMDGEHMDGDMDGDMGGEHMGGEHMGDEHMDGEVGKEDMEDRLVDLEDALSQLKAEFDDLMSHEAGEEEHGDEGEEDMEDDEEGEEDMEGGEEEDDEEGEEDLDEDVVLEYTENVGKPYGSGKGIANKSEDSGTNKTSPIAKKARTTTIGGAPIQTKDGGEGDHSYKGKSVPTPGKLTTATTKGEGTKMKKVQDMKKV